MSFSGKPDRTRCEWTASLGRAAARALVRIPVLHRLRNDDQLRHCSQVWRFETEWECPAVRRSFVLHAELWPGAIEVTKELDAVPKGQVPNYVYWVARRDIDGSLTSFFNSHSVRLTRHVQNCEGVDSWCKAKGFCLLSRFFTLPSGIYHLTLRPEVIWPEVTSCALSSWSLYPRTFPYNAMFHVVIVSPQHLSRSRIVGRARRLDKTSALGLKPRSNTTKCLTKDARAL